MKNIIILILLIFETNLFAATMIFSDGIESGNLNNFATRISGGNGTVTVGNSPVANGNYSKKHYLPYSSSGNTYRSETVLNDGKGNFTIGKEYWFSFNYFYQNWGSDPVSEIGPFQVHERPSNQTTSTCQMGSAVNWGPFLMLSKDNEVRFYTFGGIVRWKAPLQSNKWQNITVHFRPSPSSTGFIEAWKDGVKLFRTDGANMPKYDKCGKLMGNPYFVTGIYKFDWKYKVGTVTTRTLFIDDINIAEGPDGFNLVYTAPSGGGSVPPPPDTTPPDISAVTAKNITGTGATISWTTNEASDSRVDYGTTTAYGSNEYNAALVTSHSINLSGLSPGETYHFKSVSKDAVLNSNESPDFTLLTTVAGDTTKPVVSDINNTVTDTTATITWTTNEPATSRITIKSPITASDFEGNFKTTHSISFIGLKPNTTYTYVLASRDEYDNATNIQNLTLKTSAGTLPSISGINASVTQTSADISWTTDRAGDSLVRYGPTSAYGYSESKSALTTDHLVSLTDLAPGTSYRFQPSSTDINGLTGKGVDMGFTTAEAEAPPQDEADVTLVISNVTVNASPTTAVVTWETNKPHSGGFVKYIISCSTGAESQVSGSDSGPTLYHKATLVGLLPSTSYRIYVVATDTDGEIKKSVPEVISTRAL